MDSDDNVTYCEHDLLNTSFAAFALMRYRRQFCDLVIRVQNHALYAHRVIVVAAIPHIRAMLLGTEQTDITLDNVDPRALESLIEFAYSSKINISTKNVHCLLAASYILQLTNIHSACVEFVSRRLSFNKNIVQENAIFVTSPSLTHIYPSPMSSSSVGAVSEEEEEKEVEKRVKNLNCYVKLEKMELYEQHTSYQESKRGSDEEIEEDGKVECYGKSDGSVESDEDIGELKRVMQMWEESEIKSNRNVEESESKSNRNVEESESKSNRNVEESESKSNIKVEESDTEECDSDNSYNESTEPENEETDGNAEVAEPDRNAEVTESNGSTEVTEPDENVERSEIEETYGNPGSPMHCCSIRIGNFEVRSTSSTVLPVFVNDEGLMFYMHSVCDATEQVAIKVHYKDIVHFTNHLDQNFPVLLVYVNPLCGAVIRNKLGISVRKKTRAARFDPEEGESLRISFLIEHMDVENFVYLNRMFPIEGLLQRRDNWAANEVLVESGKSSQEENFSNVRESEVNKIPIWCRGIRIGSFYLRYSNSEFLPVFLDSDAFSFNVHTVSDVNEKVTVKLCSTDIVFVRGNLGRVNPVIFLTVNSNCAASIRNQLKMSTRDGPYFDPEDNDERLSMITFLIEHMNDEAINFLRCIFPGGGLLQEIDTKMANRILVSSAPNKDDLQRIAAQHCESQQSSSCMSYAICPGENCKKKKRKLRS